MAKRKSVKNRRKIKVTKRKKSLNKRRIKIIKDPAIVNFLSEHLKPINIDFSKLRPLRLRHSK